MLSTARSSLQVVLLIACCVLVFGQSNYFLADKVFDAFTFEGVVEFGNAPNVEVTLVGELGGIERWAGFRWSPGLGEKVWATYYLRCVVHPIDKYIRIGVYYKWRAQTTSSYHPLEGPGDWVYSQDFSNLPFNWHEDGNDYYWKLQVLETGYRLHFNDVQVSQTIPPFELPTLPCCQYPQNQDIDHHHFVSHEWGGSSDATFERSAAALFTRDFPCTDPCNTLRARWLFKCDALDDDDMPEWSSSIASSNPLCDPAHMELQPAKYPSCDILTTTSDNWCEQFPDENLTCVQSNATTEIWYDDRCPDPSAEYLESQNSARRAAMRERIGKSRRRMARMPEKKSKNVFKSSISKSRRSASGYKAGKASGGIDQRQKARHEAFIFNHRYLHPVCWELEDLMYLNQRSEHFPALFYWCYDALWCYAADKTRACPNSALLPRHVYEARLNACLSVRGTVWTDLQINQALLNNFSNSSFELNATNTTIFSVAPIPPSELEDNEPTFLTRLPLYQSIFGFPNCSSDSSPYGLCLFAEGVPDFMYYRYKNMEYLRDWIDGVNYNAWLSNRRREYNIPKSRFDHKRYCSVFGYMCDKNALCESRKKWPGYRCKCDETNGFYGDGYFCTQAQTFAYVKFKIFTTVGINATLEKIAERFENETGVPKEALDIASYVDVDALVAALAAGGQDVFVTMKYPTSDNQDEFDGWIQLDNSTTPTKSTALKTALSKRKRYAHEPDQPLDSFDVDRWNYADVQAFRHPTDVTNVKIRYPAPTLSAFQKYTQFEVDVVDGDSSETGVLVEVGDEETLGGGGSGRVNKELDNMQGGQGIDLDSLTVQPVASEPPVPLDINKDPKPASPEADAPTEQADGTAAASMLAAGGSVAGVVVLAVVGWTMHKRNPAGEKEAAAMAVHELAVLEQMTVEVESPPRENPDDAPEHKAQQASV